MLVSTVQTFTSLQSEEPNRPLAYRFYIERFKFNKLNEAESKVEYQIELGKLLERISKFQPKII
jgi:hypothetical protein